MRWLDGQRPDYIELTRHIPDKEPGPNSKWLPQHMEGNFHPRDFIQVPIQIDSWNEIQRVLDQIKPLKNENMESWKTRFGETSQEEAFCYVLGIMVSDAHKPKSGFTSTGIELRLSKKYIWSERVGEATCYYLGKIGIAAKKGEDRDSSVGRKTCHSWDSEKSPLITWMKQSCLGLESHERTTYNPIQAEWILNMSTQYRKRLLQGLNDGDGCASIKDQALSNTCGPNIPFVRKLLQTFAIGSAKDEHRIKIIRQQCIVQAAKLPFFLHATERQKNAEKIAEMMRVRKEENPKFIPKEVIIEVHRLNRLGLSKGEIAERIFDKFRVSYDKRRIYYILKKYLHD
jgi:hypothetical protein